MTNKIKRSPGRPSRDTQPVNSDKVLSCAWQVFSTTPYNQASLRKIADKAGISASLLSYLHSSKEALWYAAVRSIMDPLHKQFMDELDTLAKLPKAGMLEIRQLLSSCIDRTLDMPVTFAFLYREGEGASKRAKFLRDNYMQPYLYKIYVIYREACINNQQPAMDSTTFLMFFLSVVRFVFLPGLLSLILPEQQQNNDSLRHLLNGILDQLLPLPTHNN